MRWTPTHRITYAPTGEEFEAIEVMAFDLGYDHPGPGRYGLFRQEEWGAVALPDWTMDVEGRLWFRGEAPPGDGSATVKGIWDE
jgi:hypothetical protein